MSEDGINSGARNVGRFFLALIPWALGIGALVWFGVWVGFHAYRHELEQERRAASYTGAEERPKSKIEIQVKPSGCLLVTYADFNGDTLVVYVKNACHKSLGYMEYHFQALSPNGMVLQQSYHNSASCPAPTESGDIAECKFDVDSDDRMATLRVWASER